MLIALFVVAVVIFTVLAVRSGRVTGRSCCSGPWPPDDLTAEPLATPGASARSTDGP